MKYSQSYLKENSEIIIDENIHIDSSLIKATNSHILAVNLSKIKGKLTYNHSLQLISVDFISEVELIVQCALSLEPIVWKNKFVWNSEYSFSEIDTDLNYIVDKDFDLSKYLWDEIFAITPINLTKKDVKISKSGKNWKFISEEEKETNNNLDTRWASLKNLKINNEK